ncbi:MAG TPA: STAS/SEC14 domain-containing protein [Bacteroidota bacterium]|nr:STAS/SEC14 domain-containing protein [Bacteroidota bacterium]
MPIRYRIQSNILILELAGEYSKEDLRQLIHTALDDTTLPDKPLVLFDFSSSVGIFHRSSADVKEMARFLASVKHRLGQRVAFYAPHDLPFGLMRMGTAASDTEGLATEVFRSKEEALAWLRS